MITHRAVEIDTDPFPARVKTACGLRGFQDGSDEFINMTGTTRYEFTTNPNAVTCKRCLKARSNPQA